MLLCAGGEAGRLLPERHLQLGARRVQPARRGQLPLLLGEGGACAVRLQSEPPCLARGRGVDGGARRGPGQGRRPQPAARPLPRDPHRGLGVLHVGVLHVGVLHVGVVHEGTAAHGL